MKRTIAFFGKTWQQLRVAYTALRARYKTSIRMITFPIGAGLFKGELVVG